MWFNKRNKKLEGAVTHLAEAVKEVVRGAEELTKLYQLVNERIELVKKFAEDTYKISRLNRSEMDAVNELSDMQDEKIDALVARVAALEAAIQPPALEEKKH